MKHIFTDQKYKESADKALDFIKRMLDPSEWQVQPYYGEYYDDEYHGGLMWGGAKGIPDDAKRVDPQYIQPKEYYYPGYIGVIEGTYNLPAGENPADYAVGVYTIGSDARKLFCYCPLLTRELEDGSVENYWCTGRLVEAWEFYQKTYDREKPYMQDESGNYVPWEPDPETGAEPVRWYKTEFSTSKVVYWYWAKVKVGEEEGTDLPSPKAYEIELVRKDWRVAVTSDVLNKYLSRPAPRPSEGYKRKDYVGMSSMSSYTVFDILNKATVHEEYSGWLGKDDKYLPTPSLPEFTLGTDGQVEAQSFNLQEPDKKNKGHIEYGYSYFVDYKINLYALVLGDAEYLNGEAMLWSDIIYGMPSNPPDIPAVPIEIIDYAVMLGTSNSKKNYTFLSTADTANAYVQVPGYGKTAAVNKGQISEKAAYITYKATVKNPRTAFEYTLHADTASTTANSMPARPSAANTFSFIACGDPQLTTDVTFTKWAETLSKAFKQYPGASFIATLGDNVDAQVDMALAEKQFSAYLAPVEMKTHPLLVVMGNHDDNMGLDGHLFPPNESSYGVVGGMGDYYLNYEGALILVLNTNANKDRTDEHLAFMDEVIPKFINDYGRPKWIIAMFHHSIFQPTGSAEEEVYVTLRNKLAPYFSKYRVDLVLMGHVHSYCRTYVMDCSNLSAGDVVDSKCVVVGSGDSSFTKVSHGQTLYVTLNSGSGSKFYPLAGGHWYVAKANQKIIPNFSCIDVTPDYIKIITHQTDDMSVVDEFTLYK